MMNHKRTTLWVSISILLVAQLAPVFGESSKTSETLPEGWQKGDVTALRALAEKFSDSSSEANKKLASHIVERYAAGPEPSKVTGSLTDWKELFRHINKNISKEDKKKIIDLFRKQFVSTDEAVRKLDLSGINGVCNVLYFCQDPKWTKLPVVWMGGNPNWQAGSDQDLADLAWCLKKAGKNAVKYRTDLAKCVESRFLKDAKAASLIDSQILLYMSIWLRDELTPGQKTKFRAALRTKYTDSNTIQKVQMGEMLSLIFALKQLGDSECHTLPLKWLRNKKNLKEVGLRGLVQLSKLVYRGGTGPVTDLAYLLMDRLERKYLVNAESTRSVPVKDWALFSNRLTYYMDDKKRLAWSTKIRRAFLPQIEKMKAAEVSQLLLTMSRFKDTDTSSVFASWLSKTAEPGDMLPHALNNKLTVLSGKEKETLAGYLKTNEQKWLHKAEQNKLSDKDYQTITRAWYSVGDKPKAHRWAGRYYDRIMGSQEARSKITEQQLHETAGLFDYVGLSKKGYDGYAHALAALAAKGKINPSVVPEYLLRWSSLMLRSESSRKIVEASLVDSTGAPQLGLAKILTMVYGDANKHMKWRAFIDQKLQKTKDNNDLKAMWLIVRGDAESYFRFTRVWPRVKPYLDEALKIAGSPKVRLAVLDELVAFYFNNSQPADGLSILSSVKNQFSGDLAMEFSAMEKRWQDSHQRDQASIRNRQREHNAKTQLAVLEYTKKRLKLAQTNGDEDKARVLSARIRELESQMNK